MKDERPELGAKLTKEQLEARGLVLAGMVDQEAAIAALRAENERLLEALVEVGDFLAGDCIENYPFDRIPGSFADEADRLLKLIKASVGDTPQ